MKAELISTIGSWRNVADAANTTVGKESGYKDPSTSWKKRMLLAEHSPIRQLMFRFKWSDLKSWVSVHFVRHKIGIEHYVKSQRTDRTGVDRDGLRQDALVEHEFLANAQALINISRKRLCRNASKETRTAWTAVLRILVHNDTELWIACVPDCIYRGHCYEMKSCGWFCTEEYKEELEFYRKGVNDAAPEVH